MYQLIVVVHVLLGLGVIGLILMQQGKGADAGAAFGSGASGTVFGAQGAASFLSRTTAIFATLFFSTSLGLAVLSGHQSKPADIMETTTEVEKTVADMPVADVPTTVSPVVEDAPTVVPSIEENAPAATIPVVPAVVDTTSKVGDNKTADTATDVKATEEKKSEAKKSEHKEKSKDKSDKKAEKKTKSHKSDKHEEKSAKK